MRSVFSSQRIEGDAHDGVDFVESPAGLLGMLQPEVLERGAIWDAVGVASGDVEHVEIPARIEDFPKTGLVRAGPLGRLLGEKTGNLEVAVLRVPAGGPGVAGPLQVPSEGFLLNCFSYRTFPSDRIRSARVFPCSSIFAYSATV